MSIKYMGQFNRYRPMISTMDAVAVSGGGGIRLEGVHLPPVNRMTDGCKNITFPQILLRTVINEMTTRTAPPPPPGSTNNGQYTYVWHGHAAPSCGVHPHYPPSDNSTNPPPPPRDDGLYTYVWHGHAAPSCGVHPHYPPSDSSTDPAPRS